MLENRRISKMENEAATALRARAEAANHPSRPPVIPGKREPSYEWYTDKPHPRSTNVGLLIPTYPYVPHGKNKNGEDGKHKDGKAVKELLLIFR